MFKETPWLKHEPSSLLKAQALGYTARKPRGPVRRNITYTEVATPTCKRGFVMPDFCGKMCLRMPSYRLRGMVGAIRKDVRTAVYVFLTTMLHPLCVETKRVVSLFRTGTKTMTSLTQASRSAAPTSPATGTADPIQLHADAHNALNMAVFYLRQPHANVPGARRKAIQALTALRGLSLALEG